MGSVFTENNQRINYLLAKNLELEGEIQKLIFEADTQKKQFQQRLNFLLCAIFLTPLVLLFTHNRQIQKSEQNNSAEIKSVEFKTLTEKIAILEKTHIHSVKYITQPGDNLAKIGSLFFNDAKVGYRIGTDNKLHVTDLDVLLFPNDTLNIVYR